MNTAAAMTISVLLLHSATIGFVTPVEVHFDNPDGGFFVRHPIGGGPGNNRQQQQLGGGDNDDNDDDAGSGAVLSVDRFTVLQDVPQTSIRASYGPFSTKQTVPSRYLIPDPNSSGMSSGVNGSGLSAGYSSTVDISSMDVSAHLVQRRVYRENPVVRTLFHVGYSVVRSQSGSGPPPSIPLSAADATGGGSVRSASSSSSYGKLCAVVKATFEELSGRSLPRASPTPRTACAPLGWCCRPSGGRR